MSDYEPVLQTPQLGPGHAREVQVRGRPVLVLNLSQRYYALDARCPESGSALELHRGGGNRLVCPDRDAAYEIPTGARLDGDGRPLRRYRIRIDDNTLKVGPPLP